MTTDLNFLQEVCMSNIDDLEKLAELKEKGVVSAAEFENQKKALLEKVSASPAAGEAKSRVAYILLAFFLGGLGVHNFYAGYVGKGVAQLLLVLFLGFLIIPLLAVFIWCIVEMITVTKDAKGVPFV